MLRFSKTITVIIYAVVLLIALVLIAYLFPALPQAFNPAMAAPQPTATAVLSDAEARVVEKAKQYLREHATEYSLKSDLSDLRVSRVTITLGADDVVFQQFFQGIPVNDSSINVAVPHDPDQRFFVVSTYNPHIVIREIVPESPGTNTSYPTLTAKLSSANAVSKGLAAIDTVQLRKIARAELVVYPIGARGKEPQYALAWDVYLITNPYGEWEIFVDANTGEILSKGNHFVPEPTPVNALLSK